VTDFDYLDPALILVDRESRQRRELTGIEELAESIRNVGLINAIVIDRERNLIAGERRLTACLSIGLNPVPVRFFDDLAPLERHLIELEENVKRVDLSWSDHVAAVSEYHRLLSAEHPEWSMEKTAERLGVSRAKISQHLTVAEHMDSDLVKGADKFSTALNAATRIKERRAADAGQDIMSAITKSLAPVAAAPAEPEKPKLAAEVFNTNFTEWVLEYQGPKFNLIHCDFPYGVGVGDKSGQSAAKITGQYSDTAEVYRELLNVFCVDTSRFVADSAHLIFWFSMGYYNETIEALTSAGWKVDPFPLIWHKSDNAGIIPDANRGPRRTYETALFASRGDRKIVRAVANSFSGPTSRELHTSEKPRPMLHHFLRMLTDESTRLLDPTAGSGNAVRVAAELGASYALGLELDSTFAAAAQANVAKATIIP
jgi:ParB/RepB/Spo0J family partition protein